MLNQLKKLTGIFLTDIDVEDTTTDVCLSFSNGLVVQAFCYSTEFELWEYRRSDGYRLGVGPNLKAFSE